LICHRYQRLIDLLGENESKNASLKFKIDKHELLSSDAFKYVEDLASNYSNLLKLGSRPAYSLTKILEEKMRIKVIFLPMASDISQGCTIDKVFGMAALINENNAPWRRNFDLAHEFFHLITWDFFSTEEIYQDKIKGESRVEKLADVFAASLLLPEEDLKDKFDKRINEQSISYLNLVAISRDFNVPLEALLLRLVNLGLLNREKIQDDLKMGKFQDFDKRYRHTDWAETEETHISERYISLAIRAFLLGKIAKDTLAEYVDVSYSAIPSFLRKYGFDENEDYSIPYRST